MTTTEPTTSPDDVLTTGAVAAILSVDPKTVTRWGNEGRLVVGFRTLGGQRRYYRRDVDAAIEAANQRRYGGAR